MIHEIGEMAGKIYLALEKNGEMNIVKVKSIVKGDVFVFNAAIGWLAREDKLSIIRSGKALKISIK